MITERMYEVTRNPALKSEASTNETGTSHCNAQRKMRKFI